MTVRQFNLDFAPGITERFPRWEDTLVSAVYSSRQGLNGVAAKLDMSPSELSKRLSHHTDEPRPLRSQDITGIIEATGDMTPVYWLLEKFVGDPKARQQEALAQIPAVLAQLTALMEAAGPALKAVK